MKGVWCINCVYVCRRRSDGKYYRGAKWWKWTRFWRMAAMLNTEWWEFVLQMPNSPEEDSVQLVNLNDILDGELMQ